MPATTNDLLLETIKAGPEILTALGTVIAAIGSVWALIESKRSTKEAKAGKEAAQQSVTVTLQGNQLTQEVKEAVNAAPAPAPAVVVVEAPNTPGPQQ